MTPQLLTTSEVAALLNVSARTVTNWIRSERVPFLRLPGGEYRVPLDGLLTSLSGTYDLEGALELQAATAARRAATRELSMSERLARGHELSKQMTAIAGAARGS